MDTVIVCNNLLPFLWKKYIPVPSTPASKKKKIKAPELNPIPAPLAALSKESARDRIVGINTEFKNPKMTIEIAPVIKNPLIVNSYFLK